MKKNPREHSAKQRKDFETMTKSSLPKKTLAKLWKKSDDAVDRVVYLSEIYNNVPKSLKHVSIRVVEFHDIKASKLIKKKVKKWLNKI